MTNRMQQWLARAAEELGVRIVVGYVVHFRFRPKHYFPTLAELLERLCLNRQIHWTHRLGMH